MKPRTIQILKKAEKRSGDIHETLWDIRDEIGIGEDVHSEAELALSRARITLLRDRGYHNNDIRSGFFEEPDQDDVLSAAIEQGAL